MRKIVFCCVVTIALSAQFTASAQKKNATDSTRKMRGQLKEVTIGGQKEAIQTAPGKTIINVQAFAGNAGKNILDVLRRTPGVTVDGKGNVSIAGRDGVMVMIDGRQSHLSGDELRDYLESMTAEQVAKIEVISQPSAHYDAEGNAGIINLQMNKHRKSGLNGTATLTYTRSLFQNTRNTLLLNYRPKKTNWHTNLTYTNGFNGVGWEQNTIFKDANGNEMANSLLRSMPVEAFDKYDIRAGADHNYTLQTMAGFSVMGAYYGNFMNTPIFTETDLPGGSTVYSYRKTNENSLRKKGGANAYFQHRYGKESVIKADLDYLLYTKRMYQYLETEAYSDGQPVPDQLVLKNRIPLNIAIYSAKVDNSTTLADGTKLESGAKHSYVDIDNAAYFDVNKSGIWSEDESRTNRFLYKEHISALYVNSIKKVAEHWEGQAGLRGELAQIHGLQETTGEEFNRSLPALFPTAYVSYKPDDSNTWELNYGRRVSRPHYSMLNPFNYYTFYNTYRRGNPNLLPEYSHNAELKYNHKNKVIAELRGSVSKNAITYFIGSDNTTQTTYDAIVNFKGNRTANLGLTYRVSPVPWCRLMVNATGKYAYFTGLLDNQQIELDGVGYSMWLNSQLTLGKWTADCYGRYESRMVGSVASYNLANLYTNFGVSRKVLRDTTTIKVSIDDPFFVYNNRYENKQPLLENNSYFLSNSRYCTVAVSYNIGKNAERIAERNRKQIEEAMRM